MTPRCTRPHLAVRSNIGGFRSFKQELGHASVGLGPILTANILRNKRHRTALWLALFAFALSAKNAGPNRISATPQSRREVQGPRIQAIMHVTVIGPGTGAEEKQDMTILLRGPKTVAVEKSVAAQIPPGAEDHDEQGRYVMPGLWDAHVHLLQVGPKAFPLFLANGITSIRDMGSDLIEIRQWQEARFHGALIPRILTPGPKLDGMSYAESLLAEYRPDRFVVTSPETARAIVDALAKADVNFIKVHNGMTPAIYEAIADEA